MKLIQILLKLSFAKVFSLQNKVLSRYHNFVNKSSESPSTEVKFLVNLVKHDMRSVTGRYVSHISYLFKGDILRFANWRVKQMLPQETSTEA